MRDPANGSLFDPGLQLERTNLAWTRTALAFVVNAALVARISRRVHPASVGLAVAVGLALIGAALWWHGRTTYRPRSAALRQGGSPARPAIMLAVARATTVIAVTVAVLALSTLLER